MPLKWHIHRGGISTGALSGYFRSVCDEKAFNSVISLNYISYLQRPFRRQSEELGKELVDIRHMKLLIIFLPFILWNIQRNMSLWCSHQEPQSQVIDNFSILRAQSIPHSQRSISIKVSQVLLFSENTNTLLIKLDLLTENHKLVTNIDFRSIATCVHTGRERLEEAQMFHPSSSLWPHCEFTLTPLSQWVRMLYFQR